MDIAQLRRRLRYGKGARFTGGTDLLSSEASFSPPIGGHWTADENLGGYYIDFTLKTDHPSWPPSWFAPRERQLHVATAQWGFGCLERHLSGEGEAWLEAALGAGRHLLETQHHDGPQAGGWLHLSDMPHTFRIKAPWISAIAQGEAASFLARLHRQTGDDAFAAGARAALRPMEVPVSDGGTLATLDGGPFVEEYPTTPASYVLNGALFAVWGYHDVGLALHDSGVSRRFGELTAVLERSLHRYDAGYWSRYDLYPHLIQNVASPAYHLLHIKQLQVMERLTGIAAFGRMADRFERYRASAACRRRAFAEKAAFRVAIPRNRRLAHRLPWVDPQSAARREARDRAHRADRALVLCYHAVSKDWEAPLSITPDALSEQLAHLVRHGYTGATFSDIARGRTSGKVVAVTFDDAYRSVHRLAWPILKSFGLPGTLFVPTRYAGREEPMAWPGIDAWIGGPHESELVPMSWDEIRELHSDGWEIGSHTVSHPKLTTLSDEQLEEELSASRTACEEAVGAPCESLAFPYGDHDDRVVSATGRAGYLAAATLPSRWSGEMPLRWPRVGIYNADDMRMFRLKVSTPMRRLRRNAALDAAIAPARRLRGAGSD